MSRMIGARVLVSTVTLAASAAFAQATVKPDGQWRYALGAGASFSSGNTDSSSINLNGEGVRATADDKLGVYARMLYAKNNDTTTAEQIGLGGRYERNLDEHWFSFGQADYLRDKPANVSSRLSGAGGLGYHLIKTDPLKFDVFAGAGYTRDSFITPTVVAGELRDGYGRAELLLGEESIHKFTDTTSLKQRLVVYPSLKQSGEYRAVFDAGLAVAINKTMNLTASVNYRFNSDPGAGLKKGDTLFLTGISVKVE